jgi:hypothetical protein
VIGGLSSLRRNRRWLALLAVPALLLRAFLPVGFMPVAAANGWIGFCPGAGSLPPALSAPAAHPQHHHHASGGGAPAQPATAHHAPCLFAATSLPTFTPALLGLVSPPGTVATDLPAARPPSCAIASVERTQSPRAPPV